MAAFRKGHIKVVKWLVKHVHQFPSDSECTRFVSTLSDKVRFSLLEECFDPSKTTCTVLNEVDGTCKGRDGILWNSLLKLC